ncbi:hypothetical protein Hanom_Chr07g00674901 [Helianthus anomalus]
MQIQICVAVYSIQQTKMMIESKMSFSSLRFGQFCDFRPNVCFPHLDPKGLKSCHFHPAR